MILEIKDKMTEKTEKMKTAVTITAVIAEKRGHINGQ